jgi:pimeloyl-ACP methyl ester carboxylesterase
MRAWIGNKVASAIQAISSAFHVSEPSCTSNQELLKGLKILDKFPTYGLLTLPQSQVTLEYLQFGNSVMLPEDSGNPSAAETLKDLVIMFPSNPGIIQWYEAFLGRLQVNRPSFGICGTSYAGHTKGTTTLRHSSDYLEVEDIVQYQLEFLDYIRRLHPHARLHLIGHSFGALVVKEIMCRVGYNEPWKSRIVTIALLGPTLENLRQHVFSLHRLVHSPFRQMVSAVAYAMGLLPLAAQNLIGAVIAPDVPKALPNLFCFRVVCNALLLGLDEFREMHKMNRQWLHDFASKLVFFFPSLDTWCDQELKSELLHDNAFIGAGGMVIADRFGLTHAWFMRRSDTVAELVLPHFPPPP